MFWKVLNIHNERSGNVSFSLTGGIRNGSFSRDVLSRGWNHSSELRSVQLQRFGLLCWVGDNRGESKVPFQGKIPNPKDHCYHTLAKKSHFKLRCCLKINILYG